MHGGARLIGGFCQSRSVVTLLISQTSSSFGASSFKNFSAVCSSHSLSETVFLVSLSLLRLVGSFHDLHLLRIFNVVLFVIKMTVRKQSILYTTCRSLSILFSNLFLFFFPMGGGHLAHTRILMEMGYSEVALFFKSRLT